MYNISKKIFKIFIFLVSTNISIFSMQEQDIQDLVTQQEQNHLTAIENLKLPELLIFDHDAGWKNINQKVSIELKNARLNIENLHEFLQKLIIIIKKQDCEIKSLKQKIEQIEVPKHIEELFISVLNSNKLTEE